MKRIGFFGGTFDPIHLGHIKLAKSLLLMKCVDEVAFIVADDPPHKVEVKKSSFFVRFEMVKSALANETNMFACDLEFELKLRYTIDSLDAFSAIFPQDQIILIIGADSLVQLHTWKSPRLLLEKYPIITYPRPHISIESLSDFWVSEEKQKLRATLQKQLQLIDISSTQLRQHFSKVDEKHDQISDAVHAFIVSKGIYKN